MLRCVTSLSHNHQEDLAIAVGVIILIVFSMIGLYCVKSKSINLYIKILIAPSIFLIPIAFLFLRNFDLLFIAVVLYVVSLPVLLFYRRQLIKTIGYISLFFGVGAVYGLIATLLVSLGFMFNTRDIASKYFPLNAAIKNTCYGDPSQQHCPTDVSGIIAIDPEYFTQLTKNTILDYEYRPETGEYTLIVIDKLWGRGAIFDPRLGAYRDFKEINTILCFQTTIRNKPDLPGIWDKY